MSSATSRVLLGLLAGSAFCGAAHADRPEFGAFLDLQQFGEMQLSGAGGDDVTYSEVSGGATGRINNRRIVASASYRLSYRIPETGDISKSVSQDGVMRLQANVIDEWLTVDSGAIATRSRVAAGGAAPQFDSANPKNLTQTYSVFVQPSVVHRIGDLSVTASYRYAYTQNESGSTGGVLTGLPADRFDNSKAQQGNLSLGMDNSSLPFDWSVSSQYRRENISNLARHFRAFSTTAEVKVPITDFVALVTSGGYEQTRTSQRRALVDPLTGLPVLGKGGRFVVDPASPRLLTYDMDGLVGDAGIIWKPSRRTRLEARAGYRYGGLSMSGLLEMHPSERSGVTMVVTDRIESFGQGVSGGLADAPANLDLGQSLDPASSYQHCLFGKSPGTGRCIGGALGQASANTYRERAASLIFNHRMRKWSFATSLGYSRRTYIDDPGTLFSLDGVVDQSFFGDVVLTGQLTRNSGVSFSFSGNLFKNGQVGASDVLSGSFSSNYYRTFGRGIRAQASLAVESSKQDGVTADVSGRAQLGVQYQF
ncbi:porin family protein [Rhizorhabdus argentea]|uniref:hypothetical protein n=1 Tax=Rhizorhabdus argentea TaxID=1387174 RepID=UPI0030EE37B3